MLRFKLILFVALLGTRFSATGQTTELYVGSDDFVIKGGQSITINKLTLTPSSDLNLNGKKIVSSTTVTNSINSSNINRYLPHVYTFQNSSTSALSSITNYSGPVSISFAGVTNTNGLTPSNYRIHYNDGSAWQLAASSSDVPNSLVSTSSNLSAVSINELVISDITDRTLPVTWLSFAGRKQGDVVVLDWATATEQNTKDFEVEHSTNTQSWAILGTVDAAGNSNSPRNYTFTHNSPFKGNIYNYYRIKQRDLDGQFSYSRIVSLVYGEPGADVMVYPNPATTSLMVYLASYEEVRITNLVGATVWKSNLPAGRHQISVAQFARGVYLLQVGNQWRKIVLQ